MSSISVRFAVFCRSRTKIVSSFVVKSSSFVALRFGSSRSSLVSCCPWSVVCRWSFSCGRVSLNLGKEKKERRKEEKKESAGAADDDTEKKEKEGTDGKIEETGKRLRHESESGKVGRPGEWHGKSESGRLTSRLPHRKWQSCSGSLARVTSLQAA